MDYVSKDRIEYVEPLVIADCPEHNAVAFTCNTILTNPDKITVIKSTYTKYFKYLPHPDAEYNSQHEAMTSAKEYVFNFDK